MQTANGVAHALREQFGLAKGDRVAVLSQNNPEWCLTFWATVSQGAVLVGLNGWWTTDEIEYGLQDSGAKVLVADQKRFERIAGSLDQAPDLEHVFLIDCSPADVGLADDPRLHEFSELTGSPTATFVEQEIDEDDHAVIFYTSGTTGRPKGAISTHRSMIANLQNTMFGAVAGAMVSGTSVLPDAGPSQNVSLFTSPLFHVSGCHSTLVVGLLAGLKLVMPEGRFTPETALELIQAHKVTIWATVPTMVWRVCEHPDRHAYDTSSVRSVAFGGSPSADELQRMVHETFPNVTSTTNAYGLTETSSVATAITGQDAIDKPTSVGQPVPTVSLKIVDPSGQDLGVGRDRRGLHQRPDPDGGLLEEAGGHGRRDRCRRVAAHRRHRPRRRGGLPLHHRPQEGHDHPRGREHLQRRDRAAAGRTTPRSPTPPSTACRTRSWARRSRPPCSWRPAPSSPRPT